MSNPSPASGSPASTPGEDETTLSAGVPGPSGTGEQTDAGADPAAPTAPPARPAPGTSTGTDAQENA